MFTTPKQTGRSSLLPRTPLSSGKASGRLSLQSSSAKATPNLAIRSVAKTEQLLEETELHVIKALNHPVPVQVQETLLSNTRASSIKLHESGWAWLVAGNRLLLWRFVTQQHATQCLPLTLPQTPSSWNAELVTVRGQSVLACSPEGALRYWADPQQRGSDQPLEGSVDVGEGTAFSVVSVSDGFVLATSLATLYHITAPSEKGAIVVRQLQAPSSLLSGFGRRVSSLFFGSGGGSGAGVSQETLRLVSAGSGSSGPSGFFLLTATHLQKWVASGTGEQMLYDAALVDMIKDAVIQQQWFADLSLPSCLSLWVVDAQLTSACVAVLFAVQLTGQSEAHHGLALVQADSDVTPLTPDQLIRLDHRVPLRPGGEAAAVAAFCLHGSQDIDTVAMHNRNAMLLCSVGDEGSSSVVNFPAPNSIVGSGVYDGKLLFFTLNQGVIAITPQLLASSTAQRQQHKPPASAAMVAPAMVGPPPPSDELESQAERTEALKEAFSHYLDGNTMGAVGIIEQHFPLESFSAGADTPADMAVVALSLLVLDDPPSLEPSEGGGGGGGGGGGRAIIMLYRLEEKLAAHLRYVEFLCDTALLDRLTCVSGGQGHPAPTTLTLREHAERICAAIALKKAHNQLVDEAVKLVLHYRQAAVSPLPGLTPHDQYYTNLSCMEDIFPALLEHQDDRLQGNHLHDDRIQGGPSPDEISQIIISVAEVIVRMLDTIAVHRQTKASLYQTTSSDRDGSGRRYVAWTTEDGPRSVKSCVRQQLDTILNTGLKEALSNEERDVLWQLFVGLSVHLLDGYHDQLAIPELSSPAVQRGFETDRHLLLNALLEGGQYQFAAELAEKYADFGVLVSLCEGVGDRGKLREYMATFKEQGFAEFLFKQYLDKGKLQELLSFSSECPAELARFLSPHAPLSWLQQLGAGEYAPASKTLHSMAAREEKHLRKKKTLLSLSKLSLLASSRGGEGDGAELAGLDAALKVVDYQEALPVAALEQAGHTPGAEPPLDPSEIIRLYVSEESGRDELLFLQALAFLSLAYPGDAEDREKLRLHIWCQAMLRDSWRGLSTDDPLAALQTTFFYNVLQAAYMQEMDLGVLLPDLDVLLSAEPLKEAGLAGDAVFQYLLRAGYEQLNRVQSTRTNDESSITE